MAKQPLNQAPRRGGSKKDFMNKILWLVMVFLLLVFFALPMMIILFFGLLPTLAAFLIDRTREKYSAFCVASMNFAGVLPYILELFSGKNSVDSALEILTVFSLVVMYGAAGIGTLIFMTVPPMAVSFLEVIAQRNIVQLRSEQKSLLKEWGEEIVVDGHEGINVEAEEEEGSGEDDESPAEKNGTG